jgi:hypothetical protein
MPLRDLSKDAVTRLVVTTLSGQLRQGKDVFLCGEYFGTIMDTKACDDEMCRCEGQGHVIIATGGISRTTPQHMNSYYLAGRTVMEFAVHEIVPILDLL